MRNLENVANKLVHTGDTDCRSSKHSRYL